MSGDDEDMVERLLKQSILTMCKEAVHYESILEVDGLICVSTDNRKQQVVVKIHEIFHKYSRQYFDSESLRLAVEEKFVDVKHETKKPHVHIPLSDTNDRGIEKDIHMYDSDSTGGEETGTVESNGLNGLPENIDKEMHTLAIYRVYKDSKNIDGTLGDQRMLDINSSTNIRDRKENSISDTSKLPKTEPSTINTPEKPDGDFNTLNNDNKQSGLQASVLKNIHCKKCDKILDDGAAYEAHNFSVHAMYTCFVCLNTFTSRNNMNRHIRIHSGTKPYSCPMCTERFTRKDDVKRHLLRHNNSKPLRCAVCCRGYTEKIAIKLHMQREHGSNNCHSCPLCGKCYPNVDDYQLHRKSHPEYRQLACKVCTFTGSNSLMYLKHMLVHDSQKKYVCGHCNDVEFKDPFEYTNHLKEHKSNPLVMSFKCCFCDMSLLTYDQFVRHEHLHAQTKKHVCKICSKVFEWSSNLREHMLSHRQDHEHTPSSEASETDLAHEQSKSNSPKCDVNLNEVKGSVDYWCAECSEGFASEHKLERHILDTHEVAENLTIDKSSGITTKYELETIDDMHCDKETNDSNERLTHRQYEDIHKDKEISNSNSSTQIHSIAKTETLPSVSNIDGGDTKMIRNIEACSEEPEDLSTHRKDIVLTTKTEQRDNQVLTNEAPVSAKERISTQFKSLRQIESSVCDAFKVSDHRVVNRTLQPGKSWNADNDIKINANTCHENGNVPSMSLLRSDSLQSEETNVNQTKLPKLYNLVFGQPSVEDDKEIKTEQGYGAESYKGEDILSDSVPVIKKIKTEKVDDEYSTLQLTSHTDVKAVSPTPVTTQPNLLDFSSSVYNINSVLGMDTPFSSVDNSSVSLKMKVRTPGFEKVLTPEVLFRSKAPFTCEDCNHVFDDFTSFDQHGIVVHHSFICEYCGKIFTAKPNRERHVRYHTGEKPYKCEICDVAFFRGDDLKYHRTAKHGDIRPFVCKGCPRTFVWKKDFEKHIRRYPDHR